jgi:hypothetical protein
VFSISGFRSQKSAFNELTDRNPALKHADYIKSLPTAADLFTPLFFSPAELALLNGTNLLGAVQDRRKEWQAESAAVREVLAEEGLTWYVLLRISMRCCSSIRTKRGATQG